jgi:hypothetical protein
VNGTGECRHVSAHLRATKRHYIGEAAPRSGGCIMGCECRQSDLLPHANGPRVEQQAKPMSSPVRIVLLVRVEGAGMDKENGRNQRLRPSLNREASRLGDVRVRRPSSRALVPETAADGIGHRKSFAINHRALQRWRFQRIATRRNFFWLVCKKRNALRCIRNSRL